MADSECPPVTVEGDWSSVQNKTVRNKLQLYFQSKKKSSGGECRVEVEEEAPRASVFFRSEEGERFCFYTMRHMGQVIRCVHSFFMSHV
ncbi:hypothetical protein GOODEAATRI_024150 [Goodea atripinnis]|uniref:PAR14-like first RRM domain-containing protein n=1 Tax=Goodea atripinnis TaxID=208336 RepID=A0ABV0NEN0_9TELE